MAALFNTDKYEVRLADGELVIGEDGNYTERQGYVVINKETGIVEHTTIMLPGAIFQCQHFNDTLVSLLSPPVDTTDLSEMDVTDDVVPN